MKLHAHLPENRAAPNNEDTVLKKQVSKQLPLVVKVRKYGLKHGSLKITFISSDTFVLNSAKSSSSPRQPI
jgi:hypothetical protein